MADTGTVRQRQPVVVNTEIVARRGGAQLSTPVSRQRRSSEYHVHRAASIASGVPVLLHGIIAPSAGSNRRGIHDNHGFARPDRPKLILFY